MSAAARSRDLGTNEAEQKREQRAQEAHVALVGVDGDDFVFRFADSDSAHVVSTSGVSALSCTCPDHQHRGTRCKHQAAYEGWYVDSVDL